MAGKIQKPYDQLQNKRGNRRRPPIMLSPPSAVSEDMMRERGRAIDVAISVFERQFGRGAIPKASAKPAPGSVEALLAEAAPDGTGQPKRRYRPRSERTPTPAKKARAAARPRDAKGHFLKRERPQK